MFVTTRSVHFIFCTSNIVQKYQINMGMYALGSRVSISSTQFFWRLLMRIARVGSLSSIVSCELSHLDGHDPDLA